MSNYFKVSITDQYYTDNGYFLNDDRHDIPVLFPAGTTDFSTLGIGLLADMLSCVVECERNGSYTLTMEYPINGYIFEKIKLTQIIYAPTYPYNVSNEENSYTANLPAYRWQPFMIVKMTKMINGTVTIVARHLAQVLVNSSAVVPVETQFEKSLTTYSTGLVQQTRDSALAYLQACKTFDNHVNFGVPSKSGFASTINGKNLAFRITEPASMGDWICGHEGSLIDKYGGTIIYDHYTIKPYWKFDKIADLYYGPSIKDLTEVETIDGGYTCLQPYYQKTAEDGTVTSITGDIQYASYSSGYTFQSVKLVDYTSDFPDGAPTVAELNALGKADVSKWSDIAQISIDTEVNPEIAGITSLGHNLYVGAQLGLKIPIFGIDADMMINGLTYDVIVGKYTDIKLGNPHGTLSNTVLRLVRKAKITK